MNIPLSNSHSRSVYAGTVTFFIISFWSSGVFLVRVLSSYDVWSSGSGTALLYLLSIPLVYVSILGIKKLYYSSKDRGDSIVYDTISGVLLLHAVTLTLFPYLYAVEASSALSAGAWLLWFGGWALILAIRLKYS